MYTSGISAGDDLGQWKTIKRGAKKVGRVVTAPGRAAFNLVTKPLRSRVNTLVSRRAKKLSWTRRRSMQPNAQENKEARTWTKARLRAKGPHGKLLAMFAGPEVSLLGQNPGALGVEPATMTAITAAIPALTAMLVAIINAAGKSGEAPADPRQGAAAPGEEAPPAPELAPGEMGPDEGSYQQEPTSSDELSQATTKLLVDATARAAAAERRQKIAGGLVVGLGLAAAGLGAFFATRD